MNNVESPTYYVPSPIKSYSTFKYLDIYEEFNFCEVSEEVIDIIQTELNLNCWFPTSTLLSFFREKYNISHDKSPSHNSIIINYQESEDLRIFHYFWCVYFFGKYNYINNLCG